MVFVIVTLTAWFVSPAMMYVVGIIGESRILPIWKNQFRGFMPGDFLLGLSVGWLAASTTTITDVQTVFRFAGVLLALVMFTIAVVKLNRQYETRLYTDDSIDSPVKLYHDYGVIPIVFYALSSLLYVNIAGHANLAWLFCAVPIAIWAGLNVYDGKQGRYYKAHCAHIDIWSPIWRTRKITWRY